MSMIHESLMGNMICAFSLHMIFNGISHRHFSFFFSLKTTSRVFLLPAPNSKWETKNVRLKFNNDGCSATASNLSGMKKIAPAYFFIFHLDVFSVSLEYSSFINMRAIHLIPYFDKKKSWIEKVSRKGMGNPDRSGYAAKPAIWGYSK